MTVELKLVLIILSIGCTFHLLAFPNSPFEKWLTRKTGDYTTSLGLIWIPCLISLTFIFIYWLIKQ
jgi:hypothetical protein